MDIFDTNSNTGSCSIPSEVTFGIGAGGGGEEEVSQAAASHGSTKGGGATLSTVSTSFHAAEDEDDSSSSDDGNDDDNDDDHQSDSSVNNYQDAMPGVDDSGAADVIHELLGVVSADVTTTPLSPPAAFAIARSAGAVSEEGSESPTQLKKKIMSKYGEGKTVSASVTAGKKKQKKKKKEKSIGSSIGGGGGRKSSKRDKRASTSAINSTARTTTADADGISIAAYTQRKQRQEEYGADYSASAPPMAPQIQAQAAAPKTTAPAQPTDQSSSYQTTTNQSLQEAMRQAEIAEDAARRMREAVATHSGQTMDRDGSTGYGGGGGDMEGFGSSYPQGFGGSGSGSGSGGGPSSGPRVGASFLETGATACIRELLRCLADPLEALANDNSAPPGSSVTGFGSMDDPHPRFARARGSYEYVPVPNIRHVGDNDRGGSSDRDRQSNDEQSSSERKGLLGKGTGYESNW